jgi:hypothetical protein
MAFAAAFVSVVPKVRGYGDCALKAAALSTDYGQVLGGLEDALTEVQEGKPSAQDHSKSAVEKFDEIRKRKNELRPFPKDLEEKLNKDRGRGINIP